MSRTGYQIFGVVIVSVMLALLVGLFYLLTRIPIPGAESWTISGESVAHLLVTILTGTQLLLGVLFLDTFFFNTRGEHLLPMGLFLVVILVAFLSVPLGMLYIALWGRRRKPS